MKKIFLFSAVLFVAFHAQAQSKQEREVLKLVEEFSTAILNADSAALVRLTDGELVYGHSSGKMESRNEFVSAIASGRSDFKTLNTSNHTIVVKGNTAVARHQLKADIVDNGKESAANLGVILTWYKTKKQWKLLARQAFKL